MTFLVFNLFLLRASPRRGAWPPRIRDRDCSKRPGETATTSIPTKEAYAVGKRTAKAMLEEYRGKPGGLQPAVRTRDVTVTLCTRVSAGS